MTKINYKSDFDFILRLKDCADPKKTVPFPDGDFDARFWTSNKANAYIASCRDGVYTNCFRTEDGGMHFVFDDHRMGKGTLHWEPHFELPNDIYPDNMQDLYRKAALDIELVDGDGDCPTTAELEAILPYIKGEPFTWEDFTPEQIAELQRPATEAANSVLKLEKAVETAEKKRIADEEVRQRAEQERISAEETRESNESARQNNEQTRQEAEANRQEAETERATKFATFEPIINEKQNKLVNSADVTVGVDNKLTVTDSAKRAVFIDRWNARCVDMHGNKCGGYNEATGYFELNGLTDITYAQAMEIMSSASYWCRAPIGSMPSMSLLNIRTAFPFGGYGNSLGAAALNSTFKNCEKLEVVVVQSGNFTPLNGTFLGCKKLRKVVLNTEYSTSFDNAAFYQCYALEELSVQSQILSNINLSPCSRLSVASASNITAKGKSGITVTVHADVFAKLTGDMTNEAAAALTDDEKAAWAAVLEAACAKNISFAAA